MLLKFWGTRGSIPAPLRPDQVEQKVMAALETAGQQKIDVTNTRAIRRFVAGLLPDESTIGGNTTCVTIELEKNLLIFDAGSGIRELGEYLMNDRDKRANRFGFHQGRGHAHLFFTHTHQDHIQGFPFFKPLHVPGNTIDIYHVHDYVPDVLTRQMAAEFFPLQFNQLRTSVKFHRLAQGEPVKIAEAVISHIELEHPGKAYAYRVEADNAVAILATDGEYEQLDEISIAPYRHFYRQADVLIFDAMLSEREVFRKESWDRGHSAALIGADIAREAQVKQLFLFHGQPFSNSHGIRQVLQQTKEYLEDCLQLTGRSPEIVIAQEGMEITLVNPKPTLDFYIEDYVENKVIFMSLFGRFGSREIEQFRERLADHLQTSQASKVILRMENLSELTVGGILALLGARKIVMSLALVGMRPKVYQVFELARVTDFFAIYQDLDAALLALNSFSQDKHL